MLNKTVIDARQNSSEKTSSDRQRFVRRAKNQIKEAVKKAISTGSIKSLEEGRIKVPVKDMDEPFFHHDPKTGSRDRVYSGNKDWVPGDTIPRPDGGGSSDGSQASNSGEGEDEFGFLLTPEEFYDFMFEDLALPDLIKKSMKQVTKVTRKRAGFVTSGAPCQLDIKQTYKFAFARHLARGRPSDEDVEEAELKLKEAESLGSEERELYELEDQLTKLKSLQKKIPLIDDIDLRYRNYPPKPEPITQAVMICVMDVSGSMDEQRKDIAKRFYLLLYVWLMKQYNRKVEIVYIRHHTRASEVDEETFFYSHESGGTIVSPAIELTTEIIRKRYNPNDWNIYVANASDGDNWYGDNAVVIEKMHTLMPMLQYFAYLQVAETYEGNSNQGLWEAYSTVAQSHKHLHSALAIKPEDIFDVFRELFTRDLNK